MTSRINTECTCKQFILKLENDILKFYIESNRLRNFAINKTVPQETYLLGRYFDNVGYTFSKSLLFLPLVDKFPV